ncbi:S-adenosylmethionine:tRNA ribosyltransferase-isomerase [Actinocrinis puniceicyclus]|uniref:S-adenosylmethionine:tRNA ribosyltransferase-isomerase n=1 Tax=Actinocrinis puniceicyclus TaxID=977794 RepID=A0A8J7WQP5_9ACTN|nr:S-adenosylmethionine:tRNA ribosyltransferase-isomerase [Actinocrinis puniceicyclus]MBS2964349.1 S-adenosylmethionine:tRNA ribosyltransferase-isomerase [Actinocrinis puniceicyclus]
MMLIRDGASPWESSTGAGATIRTDFDFSVPDELSAHAPAEARGLRRDEARMLVGERTRLNLSHHTVADLPQVLRPGDLLIVNNSATLPAALKGTLPDGTPVAVHVSAARPGAGGEHLVELRRPRAGSSVPYAFTGTPAQSNTPAVPSPARPGLRIALPGDASLELAAAFTQRLWYARFRFPSRGGEPGARRSTISADPVQQYLGHHGKPIRYSYVDRDWPLSAYQSVFAAEPGSSEMPSAARPFTPELVAALVARGILVAPITLHTGLASPEAHEAPYAERYRVPDSTARLVNHVHDWGGRVIAVGTTAVRALESAADARGRVHAADGWTELIITAHRGVRAVDGLLTGWHEPRASHLLMLEAVAGRPLLDLCYAEAIRERYLWHEFGDVNLLLAGRAR